MGRQGEHCYLGSIELTRLVNAVRSSLGGLLEDFLSKIASCSDPFQQRRASWCAITRTTTSRLRNSERQSWLHEGSFSSATASGDDSAGHFERRC